MALRIETFDNTRGGNTLYKALTHPGVARAARALLDLLAHKAPVAVYDPSGAAEAFAAIFDMDHVELAGAYVQQVARIGSTILGQVAQPVTDLAGSRARSVLVAAFDAERIITQLRPYLPVNAEVLSLDAMRVPSDRLTNRLTYLDSINFVTNFAFFRDADGLHTRLVTANYWSGYGSAAVTCWLTLFDGAGEAIAEWSESCGDGAIVIDSREVRARFRLGDFAGQLFIHVRSEE